jgi:1-acyl-sn-glycerol-3-phosphate acyltransferase
VIRILLALFVCVGAPTALAAGRSLLPRGAFGRIEDRLRPWAPRTILRLLRVRYEVSGSPPPDRALLVVSNHLGYLDIPLLAAALPVRFVAKEEIARWPLIGIAAKGWGSIFVRRGTNSRLGGFVAAVVSGLEAGHAIVAFPEGTSTDGTTVLPFKTGAFAAVENSGRALVLPVHLGIESVDGRPPSDADRQRVAWIGDATMVGHLWRFLRVREVRIRLSIGEPIDPSRLDRKELAQRARAAVCLAARSGQPVTPGVPCR